MIAYLWSLYGSQQTSGASVAEMRQHRDKHGEATDLCLWHTNTLSHTQTDARLVWSHLRVPTLVGSVLGPAAAHLS